MEPIHVGALPPTLDELGWDTGWAVAFTPFEAVGWRPARVTVAHRDAWVIASPLGERDAVVAGRLRHLALGPADLPAVGDWVAVASETPAGGPEVIRSVLPRRSAFRRNAGDSSRQPGARLGDEQVLAANVDVALVVAGLDGDFNLRRLERYLAVALDGGVEPVVVLNKADLAPHLDAMLAAAVAVAPGIDVRAISARSGEGVPALASIHLRAGRTGVVLGSSGAGKSTLVNALLGHERQRTRDVREDDSRGRHTTTRRELIRLPGGALLVDTPGLRSLAVAGAADGLGAAFADVSDLATDCRFRDCRHEQEPGCAVRAALADGSLEPGRFASHRKLEREAAWVARASDPLLRAAERRRWKAIHASVNQHMQRKYGGE